MAVVELYMLNHRVYLPEMEVDTVLSGLDIGPWQPLARGASESENPLAPQKTHWPPKNM